MRGVGCLNFSRDRPSRQKQVLTAPKELPTPFYIPRSVINGFVMDTVDFGQVYPPQSVKCYETDLSVTATRKRHITNWCLVS